MAENRRTFNMRGRKYCIPLSLLSVLPSQIVLPFTQSTFFQDIIRGTTKILIKFRDFNSIFFFSCHRTPRYWVSYFERFFQFFFIFVVVVRFFGVFAKIRKKDRSLRSFKRPNGIIKLRTPFHTTHIVWGKDINVRN